MPLPYGYQPQPLPPTTAPQQVQALSQLPSVGTTQPGLLPGQQQPGQGPSMQGYGQQVMADLYKGYYPYANGAQPPQVPATGPVDPRAGSGPNPVPGQDDRDRYNRFQPGDYYRGIPPHQVPPQVQALAAPAFGVGVGTANNLAPPQVMDARRKPPIAQ
jgi:hypothetical protein